MKQIRVAIESEQRRREWALVLAGGDGTRLNSMTRHITGDDRPKQFCKLIGDATLLEQTQRRVQIEFAPHRTLHVLNRAHESYYAPMVTAYPLIHVVIQRGSS